MFVPRSVTSFLFLFSVNISEESMVLEKFGGLFTNILSIILVTGGGGTRSRRILACVIWGNEIVRRRRRLLL
mgnify:CR=1 FL=1